MAYGEAKGRIFRGDIYNEDDPNEDTFIDWGNDFISFAVAGTKVLNVSGTNTIVKVLGTLSASVAVSASALVVSPGKSITLDGAANTFKLTNNGTNLDINGANIILNGQTVSASAAVTASAFVFGPAGRNIISDTSTDMSILAKSTGMFISADGGNLTLQNNVAINQSGVVSSSVALSASAFYGDGSTLSNLPSAGISWDGSTANGVATYKDSDEATVESNLTFDGTDLGVSDKIFHIGDTDTFINFTTDDINLQAGGVNFIDLTSGSQHEITFNEAGVDIDFRVETADESHMLFIEGSSNRMSVGDNTGSPGATLEVKNHASAGAFGVPLVQLNSNDTDQQCLDINASNITANVVNVTANAVTTARVLAIGADGLTTGNAVHVDDNSPSTATRNTALIIQNHTGAIAATALAVQSDGGITGVKVDKNYADTSAATVTGLEIDFDKTAATTTNNTMYGLNIDMDNTTATNGNNYMYGLHVTPTLTHAADAGGAFLYGALINAQGGTNGSSLVQGARIEAGGGDFNYGLQLDVEDGGIDLRIESSADAGDYFQIQTTTHGATTFTTQDDDATAAHLTCSIDGDILLDPAGGNVTIDGNLIVCAGTASILHLSGCSPIQVHAPMSSSYNISASAFYGDGSSLTGLSSDTVDTTTETSDSTFYIPFVNQSTGQAGETLYIHDVLALKPSSSVFQILETGQGAAALIISSSIGESSFGGAGRAKGKITFPGKPGSPPTSLSIAGGYVDMGGGDQDLLTITGDNAGAVIMVSASSKVTIEGGSLDLKGPVEATKTITAQSGIDVAGAQSNFSAAVSITGSTDVGLNVGSVYTGGASILAVGNILAGHSGGGVHTVHLNSNGDISGAADLSVGGRSSLKGDLTVLGNANVTTLSASSTLDVAGGTVLGNQLTVRGHASASSFSVAGQSKFGNGGAYRIKANGQAIFGAISGSTVSASSDLNIGGDGAIKGFLEVGSGLDISAEGAVITGSVAISASANSTLFRVDGGDTSPVIFATGSGRVAIGHDSPAYALSVNGYVELGNGSGTGYVVSRGDVDTYLRFGVAGSDSMAFVAGGRQLLTLDENGTDKVILGDSKNDKIIISGSSIFNGSIGVQTAHPLVVLDVHYTGSGNPIDLTNDTGGGEVVYFGTSSANLTAGGVYYLNKAGGWASVDSANTGSGHNQLLGIALGTTPGANGMLVKGYCDVHTFYSGSFIKGGPMYIQSASAARTATEGGYLSGAAPSATDSYVRVVGYGTDTANVIYFNPDATYVEIS